MEYSIPSVEEKDYYSIEIYKMASKFEKNGFHSICVKDPLVENQAAHVPPIYATSTFTYDDLDAAFAFFRGESDKFTYSRLGNPGTAFVAEKIAALESWNCTDENDSPLEARGLLFASGMAAIATALTSQLQNGDVVLTQGNLYGTTNELLTQVLNNFGIQTLYGELKDPEHVENAIINDERIKVLYLETPANPTLECYDLEALCTICNNLGVKVIVDNTFATPYLQQPLKYGADIVVHSSTKFLNGHGTGISGVLVAKSKEDHKKAYKILKNFGSVCSPFEAYLLNNGLKTLPLRMEKHQSNAAVLAQFLVEHPAVSKVNYLSLEDHPDYSLAKYQMNGHGGMLSFELAGGLEAGLAFQRSLRFCTLTASLGTADTLITHPASTSHINVPEEQRAQYGITPGLVRVSVGLEDIDDILEDIGQALDLLVE